MLPDSPEHSDHDQLILAMVKILSAYDYQVQYTVKGQSTKKLKVKGDSGKLYKPDIIAERGPWKIVCEIRTRGQRGRSDKLDPGAIQLAMAEFADMQSVLKRPHGMLITPYGILPEAKKLADHFGIIIAMIPNQVVDKILSLDFHSQKEDILSIAREFKLIF